mmetsp:Transcript_2215/g.4666  ORF Transcript_2215/g.4666 Transcript_2215/m.4666 type:complete len:319 (+) Transcript_2215:124-1080(+)
MWPQSGGAGQGVPPGAGGYGMAGPGMMSMQQAMYNRGSYGGYPGAMYPMQPYAAGGGGQGMGGAQGCGGYGSWGYGGGGGGYGGGKSNGQGKGGKGKGKGRGKGFFSGEKGYDKGGSMAGAYDLWKPEGSVDIYDGTDPRRAIEIAQRRAKQRDRSAISVAQRCAQQRFEQNLLDRIQGRWIDESDPGCTYVVEGSLCSVSSTANPRVFRNRITLYGGELCWDARRFWHYLKIDSLPALGEEVARVEWIPGEGSPPTQPITWLKATSQEEDAPGDGEAPREEGEEGDEAEAPAEDSAPPAEEAPAEAVAETAEAAEAS